MHPLAQFTVLVAAHTRSLKVVLNFGVEPINKYSNLNMGDYCHDPTVIMLVE